MHGAGVDRSRSNGFSCLVGAAAGRIRGEMILGGIREEFGLAPGAAKIELRSLMSKRVRGLGGNFHSAYGVLQRRITRITGTLGYYAQVWRTRITENA